LIFTDGNGAAKNLSGAPHLDGANEPWTAGNNVSPATNHCNDDVSTFVHVRHLDQHRGALRPRTVPRRRTRRESGAVGDLIGAFHGVA
jgi:hypothetical protein